MNVLGKEHYHLSRQRMVENQLKARGIMDKRVIAAMTKTPRHLFVEEAFVSRAYGDHPLPIGEQQTISQPYIVAQMSEALGLEGNERVLEVGTGSGYQTAVLADLCYRVYTIERLRPLMIRARQLLADLGYTNILFRMGDGSLGWPEEAPFDAIIATAGAPEIPMPLVNQLGPGGRLVAPVGRDRKSQILMKIEKDANGRVTTKELGGCRFVDLVGQHGW